jgi:hypothetical protein
VQTQERGERGQRVEAELEYTQAAEVAEPGRQRGELVVGKVEHLMA